jgi:hypothetical protein
MTTSQKVRRSEIRDLYRGRHAQSVAAADYVVYIGEVHQGGVVNFAKPGQRVEDRIRSPSTRPYSLPRAVTGFLDREQELSTVGQALARRQIVDLHGSDGVGKTALVSQVLLTILPRTFPDGIVYLAAGHDGYEDVLQELFRCFFEVERGVMVTENDVRRYMTGKQALIAIDDANKLGERKAEALAGALPHCAVLVAGVDQQVWQAVGISLGGLPWTHAVALFERYWGPVSPQDRPTVEAICQALNGTPLSILRTATIARDRHLPLAQVQQQVQSRTGKPYPVRQAFRFIASILSEGEQCVLGALAASGGQTVGIEALPAIANLLPEKITQHLKRLQRLGLVKANSPRYSLDDAFRPYARHYWADEGMRERAANYYLRKAADLRAHSKDPDEENVMAALGYFYRRKRWREVIQIVRTAERYLATTGRWGQWRKRLNHAWQAARALGDQATEAWAQNQLGLIAMGLGDKGAATGLFRGALHIWKVLGDQTGMTITRWNLQILLGPPPPPPPKAESPVGPGGTDRLIKILGGVAGILVIIFSVLVIKECVPPSPTPTVVAIAHPPTATPGPTPTQATIITIPTIVTVMPTPAMATVTPTPATVTVTPTPATVTVTPTPSVTTSVAPVCQCGDGACVRDYPCYEEGSTCMADCCQCNDGYCESTCGENEGSCPEDCSPSAPPAPIPIEPSGGAELTCDSSPAYATLRWTAVDDPSGISGYVVRMQAAPTEELGFTETDYEAGNTTSHAISLDCGRMYRWVVRAIDGAGYSSPWSEWAEFSTIPAPPAPTPLEPGIPGPGFDKLAYCTVVLSWTAVSHPGGIAYYEANLQNCGQTGASCSGGQTFSTAQTSYDISLELAPIFDIYHRWNVRAIGNDGRVSETSFWLYFKERACP